MKYSHSLIAVSLVASFFITNAASAASLSTKLIKDRVLYTNHRLSFQIAVPTNELLTDTDDATDYLGRVDTVQISKSEASSPDVNIRVYTSQAALDKDYANEQGGSFAQAMRSLNLRSVTKKVNGKDATVYYGVHAADGVGGKEYPYIATVVSGSRYSYIIEFFNTKNPNSSSISRYLASFKAN